MKMRIGARREQDGLSTQLGIRLRALREFYGWSQRELAKRAGVPNSAISVIEQGTVSPSVQSLEKVLKGFPFSLNDFFAMDLDRQNVTQNPHQMDLLGADSGGLLMETGIERLGLNVRYYALDPDDPPLNLTNQNRTLVLVIGGEGAFHSLNANFELKRGDSLTIDAATPFRVEPSKSAIDWLVVSLSS